MRRPSTSTGTQNTTTVAMAMRMLAPHAESLSCFLKMKMTNTQKAHPDDEHREYSSLGWTLNIEIKSQRNYLLAVGH